MVHYLSPWVQALTCILIGQYQGMDYKQRLKAEKKMKKARMSVEASSTTDGTVPSPSPPANECPYYYNGKMDAYPAGKQRRCFDLVVDSILIVLKHLGANNHFKLGMARRIALRALTRFERQLKYATVRDDEVCSFSLIATALRPSPFRLLPRSVPKTPFPLMLSPFHTLSTTGSSRIKPRS